MASTVCQEHILAERRPYTAAELKITAATSPFLPLNNSQQPTVLETDGQTTRGQASSLTKTSITGPLQLCTENFLLNGAEERRMNAVDAHIQQLNALDLLLGFTTDASNSQHQLSSIWITLPFPQLFSHLLKLCLLMGRGNTWPALGCSQDRLRAIHWIGL